MTGPKIYFLARERIWGAASTNTVGSMSSRGRLPGGRAPRAILAPLLYTEFDVPIPLVLTLETIGRGGGRVEVRVRRPTLIEGVEKA